MNRLPMVVASVLLLSQPFPTAINAQAKQTRESRDEQEQSLPGIYQLVGQMETASGLRLKEDKNFDWYLTVGALDVIAGGTWALDGELVTLEFEKFESNQPAQDESNAFPITEIIMRKEADRLVPLEGLTGIYIRVEPKRSD